MSNADILKAAKHILTEGTWVQGDHLACAGGDCGCYCAATAIGEAINLAGIKRCMDIHPAFGIFKNAAGIPLTDGIGGWNDAPERTKDEVLAAFDKAIALAEAA